MSSRHRRTRSASPHDFASVRADMQTAEAERRRAIGIGLGLCVLAIVILAVTFYSIRGASASPDDMGAQRTAPVVTSAPLTVADVAPAAVVEPEVPVEPPTTTEEALARQAPQEAAEGTGEEKPPAATAARKKKRTTQKLRLAIGDYGYAPSVLKAKAGVPIKLTVEQGEGCAAGFVIPELDIVADNSAGPVTLKLGVLEAGDYRFACGMEMVEGVLRVR